MRVRLHGLYPHKLTIWKFMKSVYNHEALVYYNAAMKLISEKPEARTPEQLDERFMEGGYKILYKKGLVVLALYRKWPDYDLIATSEQNFVIAFKQQQKYHPNRVNPYGERP